MTDAKDYHLGDIAARYESNGPGTVSTGKDDKGGVSYGTYQLSSNEGTLADYLKQSPYKYQFDGLAPGSAAFNNKWSELGRTDLGFAQDQQDFIKKTHFDPVVAALQKDGLDLTNRGPAVQEALWSTSVQTRGLTPRIFEHGLEEKFGKGYKLSDLSDKDIVGAVQDYKIAHTATLFKSSPRLWENLIDRAEKEKEDLLALADGKPLPNRSHAHQAPSKEANELTFVLKQGHHGDAVRHAQDELQSLGYLHGASDGSFGPVTKAAVESFQQDQGLQTDGTIGPWTQQHLDAASRDKQLSDLTSNLPSLREFSDPSHPQNALYNTLRDGFPPGTSPELLSQATAACYMSGIRQPHDLGNVTGTHDSILFDTSSLLAKPAVLDISQPAPSVQQTMQQVQQYDQQQAQIQAQVQQANQQANLQQQGPVMGGPQMGGR